MIINGLVRLGRDGEMKSTTNGKRLLSLVFCFDSGFGDNKITTWCEGAMFGDRGENLAQYLLKGQQVFVSGDNVSIESFTGKNGLQTKLKMTINNIELVARSADAPKPVQQVNNNVTPSYSAPDDFNDLIQF